ncbi:MAG: fumarylacetoacetate hydrolase family protein [Pseudomonadota bacterium]
MRLIRHGVPGAEKPGLMDAAGAMRDLSQHVDDINAAALSPASLARLAAIDPVSLPHVPDGTRLGPCVGNVGKMVCIGKNYALHAAESGSDVPKEPMIFMKANSAIQGPNDPVIMPRGSVSTDWEVELAVVIGTAAKYVRQEAALDHVAGYCIVNDVSEREFQQKRSGQYTKGKSCDTYGPMGPWLLTADHVPDPQALRLKTTVNGTVMQDGTTADMVFGVARLVSYLSQFFTLYPGDVISTGTPDGVAMGRTPPNFLRAGDIMELEVEGLGKQRQEVRAQA